MRRTQVGELPQDVRVGLEARRRTLVFRQEGEAVIDHVVSEHPAVGIFRRLRRIEAQNIGKRALLVDCGNRFLTRLINGVPHEMHELIEPSLAVIDGFAGVVFLFCIIGVEETADARMARPIDVKQLAIPSYAAASPDVDFRLGIDFARRKLDHGREHVRFCIRVHPCPRRLPPRWGSVKFRLPLVSNRFLIPSKSKKNASLRLPAKKV
jgi:hypothetical protein